jgi:hypothetical protein
MSTEFYAGFFTAWHRGDKQATTVCTVCGNDTPLADATNVSDDPDATVLVGQECIMGWFAWQELQGVPSFIEQQAAVFAQEELR